MQKEYDLLYRLFGYGGCLKRSANTRTLQVCSATATSPLLLLAENSKVADSKIHITAKHSVIIPVGWKKMIESYFNNPIIKSFLAGSFSGTCSTILFQPLDLVKTRIQSPVAIGRSPNGILTVVVSVIRSERLTGLWKGVAPSLSRTVPGIGVYFCSLDWLRSNLGSVDPSPLESMCMGAGARSIAAVAMLPFTVIKTRYESGHFKYSNMTNALISIYRSEGARGLYSGLTATLLRDAPFSGLYLMFYTQIKKYVKQSEVVVDPATPVVYFTSGMFAGCLASLVTQPADVIKTHMQLYPDKFSKVRVVIWHIYQKDGMVGFVRGIVPRTMRRTLMAAMAWTVYEQVMKSVGLK